MKMIDKKYDHTLVEKNRYNNWKEKGYFETLDKKKEPFCDRISLYIGV